MTDESKRRLSTFCIFASASILLAALYGMLFVKPEPGWSKLAASAGILLSLLGNFLAWRTRRAG
jgi:Mg2+ and Co2+ transporter CorA